jgi:ADP-heptose:LPS heptosyltransferase
MQVRDAVSRFLTNRCRLGALLVSELVKLAAAGAMRALDGRQGEGGSVPVVNDRSASVCRSQRILAHRVGQVGDLACAIPALVALRRAAPEAWIALLTSPVDRRMVHAFELFAGCDYLDEIIPYYGAELRTWRTRLAFAAELRRRRWDLFVELPQIYAPPGRVLRDWLFAWMIGVRRTAGFSAALRGAPAGPVVTEAVRLLDLLRREGVVPADAALEYRVPVTASIRTAVEALLRGGSPPFVGLNPGAKRQANRWSPERFASVGRTLAARGACIVLTGAPGERGLCNDVGRRIGGRVLVAAGGGDLLFTAEILRRCALLVSNDTGTVHLAAAMGTPVVVTASARDVAGRWDPTGDRHRVLRHTVACGPCFRETCDHLTCLRLIGVDDVVAAALTVLGRSQAGTGETRAAS